MNNRVVINSCVKIKLDDVRTGRIPNFVLSQRKTNCFQLSKYLMQCVGFVYVPKYDSCEILSRVVNTLIALSKRLVHLLNDVMFIMNFMGDNQFNDSI